MKKVLLLGVLCGSLLTLSAQDYGIRFFEGSWKEALQQAQQEKKMVFVDFFTEWCGPCLNMATKVFVLPQVGEMYNRNFINLKVDAEKGEGAELARRYEVTSYPTYLFLDPVSGEIIHRSGSNKPAEDFLYDAWSAITPQRGSVFMEKSYAAGGYDAEFLKGYILCKKAAGGSRQVLPLFNELIGKGGRLDDPDVWNIYCEAITGYDNPYLKEIGARYDHFVSLFGKQAVDRKLAEATAYAPVNVTESLPDFAGKRFNILMRKLSALFQQKQYDRAFAEVKLLRADTTIDQQAFLRQLTFYVRISPQYQDPDLPFETIAGKVHCLRDIAYNLWDRDEATPHFQYAIGLEYLMQRAQQEGKPIPADLLTPPSSGKPDYTLRPPGLKEKPRR